ncbi:hypothetical protein HAT93_02439 [Dickeya solani]|nr:hypothetical protein [Dickeya solani]
MPPISIMIARNKINVLEINTQNIYYVLYPLSCHFKFRYFPTIRHITGD